MQKIIAIVLVLTCLCGMIGCTTSGSETDYPAAIMVDGEVYYLVSEPMAGEGIAVFYENEWHLCAPED